MQVKFDSKGGFNNVLKWMEDATKIPSEDIKQIAELGKTNLMDATPEETGETARGWTYDMVQTKSGFEIDWKNTAHPEAEVNVAMIVELGHGTKTGGYVPPRPYIKQAMKPVWDKLDKDVEGLMK